MRYSTLGTTGLNVSRLALGSMLWGTQLRVDDAFRQLDFAYGHGVNLIDTAELYPVPPSAARYGQSETILGSWIHERRCRDSVVLISKVAGPADWASYIRAGPKFTSAQIREAVRGSLKRLRAEYIDVYLLHWPPPLWDKRDNVLEDVLATLCDEVQSGRIRFAGVSNETSVGLDRIMSTQQDITSVVENAFSILENDKTIGNLAAEKGLGFVAHSTLGGGVLTGKYLSTIPPGSRLSLYPGLKQSLSVQQQNRLIKLIDISRALGLSPAAVAIAYVNAQVFVDSLIAGARTMEQLSEAIKAISIVLDASVFDALDQIGTDEMPLS